MRSKRPRQAPCFSRGALLGTLAAAEVGAQAGRGNGLAATASKIDSDKTEKKNRRVPRSESGPAAVSSPWGRSKRRLTRGSARAEVETASKQAQVRPKVGMKEGLLPRSPAGREGSLKTGEYSFVGSCDAELRDEV